MALSSLKRLDQKWLSIKNIFQKINILTTKKQKRRGRKQSMEEHSFSKPFWAWSEEKLLGLGL